MEAYMKVKSTKIKRSKINLAFDIANFILMGILVILIILPLLNVLSLAFSKGEFISQITFYPKGLTFAHFKKVFNDNMFWRSTWNSVIITVAVTIISNIIVAAAAYPLSKIDCPFRKGILLFFVVTMLFSPGITPIWIMMNMLGMLNKITSLILIAILNVFNMLLFKTFFEGLPEEIEEAAKIDGASGLRIFRQIVIPMSLPVVASCCFFTAVGTWNSYGAAILFITEQGKNSQPLALYTYNLLQQMSDSKDVESILNYQSMQSAVIIISIIPILAVYPYVVRYIKSGLSIGSVKG